MASRLSVPTVVERAIRYVMLLRLHLPDNHRTENVRDALVTTIQTLPVHLRRSLSWDQSSEMSAHSSFTVAADVPVYFCDPASPWQRCSDENTNGLPKGTDLAAHSPEDLAAVASELNSWPRKTLGWETPSERLARRSKLEFLRGLASEQDLW